MVQVLHRPSDTSRTRTFASFTGSLEAMADWFTAEGVTEIAMEATGSYWKPVWYVLEERAFELKLVNAQHVKILPGRKSDVLDCCAALKMPMSAALWVPMVWGEKTPPGGAAAGFSSVWCRLWSAWCRWCQSMTSVTAERAALSSTRFLPPANAATRDCSARLLTARG